MSRAPFLLAVLLILGLGACLPSTDSTLAPRFTLLPGSSGLRQLDLPGVGAGEAVFHVALEVQNPNSFGMRFAGIRGAFFINGQRVAAGLFEADAQLEPGLSQTVGLEIGLAIDASLVDTLAELIKGGLTDYQLVGQPTLDYGGLRQSLPETEVFAATWTQEAALVPPEFSLQSGASFVSALSAERAVIEVALTVENPGPLGYRFHVPDLELVVNGERVENKVALTGELAARQRLSTTVHFTVAPDALSAITADEVRRLADSSAPVPISLSGALELELPGLRTERVPEAVLSAGFLR